MQAERGYAPIPLSPKGDSPLGATTVELQDEAYTSQTCPACGERHKPTGREYRCKCGFRYHRDGVGSWNIRAKYLGDFGSPVVGAMASPTGVRYAL